MASMEHKGTSKHVYVGSSIQGHVHAKPGPKRGAAISTHNIARATGASVLGQVRAPRCSCVRRHSQERVEADWRTCAAETRRIADGDPEALKRAGACCFVHVFTVLLQRESSISRGSSFPI